MRIATRLAETVIRLCSAVTPEGSIFPIDAGLRPEGKAGPLVRSLASHEAYYRRWAHTWEYQALLKARPLAGDVELGRRYMSIVTPMVWAASSRPNFVVDVQAMRRRVVQSLPRSEVDREVKLGPGGLRDIEFAVQLLQLVHGRSDESIRQAATLPALAALAAGGYVGRVDAVTLAAAYRFLRSVEHRLQLQRLRRTHIIPTEPFTLRWLARSLGFRDGPALEAERQRHAREVRRLHEKLFYRPLLTAVARLPAGEMSMPGQRRRLRRVGPALRAQRHDPARSARIRRPRNGFRASAGADPRGQPDGRGATRAAAGRCSNPSPTPPIPTPGCWRTGGCRTRSAARPGTCGCCATRAGSGRRSPGGTAERLARLLATSPYVADLLTRAPEAVRLLAGGERLRPRTRAELEVGLLAGVRRRDELGQAWQATVGVARAARRLELFRVACADLLGQLDVTEVGTALSDAAEATLAAAYEVALRSVEGERRCGAGRAADADGGDRHGPARRARARLRQRRRRALRPRALRPEGEPPAGRFGGARGGPRRRRDHAPAAGRARSGSAARARLRAAARGQAGAADPVTRVVRGVLRALVARLGGAGAAARAARSSATRTSGCASPRSPTRSAIPKSLPREAVVGGAAAARAGWNASGCPRGVDRSLHLKLGPGGLTDVEWAAQLLQLRYGPTVAEPAHDRDPSGAGRSRRRRAAVGRGGGDAAHGLVVRSCGRVTPSCSRPDARRTCCPPRAGR